MVQLFNDDIIGVNPKYMKLIETKLNDSESYNTYIELVNYAYEQLKHLIKCLPDNRKYGLWRDRDDPGCFRDDLFMPGRNKDTKRDGSWQPHAIDCAELKNVVSGISGPRLTKYVNMGLMKRYKGYGKNNKYRYYFPYDFFTTNDMSIRFTPNLGYENIVNNNF